MKSTTFPNYFSKKLFWLIKSLRFYRYLKLLFLAPRPSMVGSESGLFWRHRRTWLKTLKRRLTGFRALWKHIWGICASYFISDGSADQTRVTAIAHKWLLRGNHKYIIGKERVWQGKCRSVIKTRELANPRERPMTTSIKYMSLTQSAGKLVQPSYDWFWFYLWSNI